MNQVPNPYFSVEISEAQINSLRSQVRKILSSHLELEFQDLHNPHISVSYVLGQIPFKTIEEAANEIIEAPFKMKIKGFASIDSEFYQGTIISLAMEHTDDFLYSQEFLKEVFTLEDPSVKIKEFKGGFAAHISLFVIKGLNESQKNLLPRYLELCLNDLGNQEIRGEKFCMYDPDRNKLLEKLFKN